MKRLVILLAGFMPLLLTAQERVVYDDNVEVRNVEGFHTIKVNNAIKVVLTPDNEHKVAVTASKASYVSDITTYVKDSILYIGYGDLKKRFDGRGEITAYVGFNRLKKIQASGASKVEFNETVRLDSLHLDISGASTLKAHVEGAILEVKLSGASNTSLTGQSEKLFLTLSGASNFKGENLLATECLISSTGASNAVVNVQSKLLGIASGASTIKYKGAVSDVTFNTTGASSVKRF